MSRRELNGAEMKAVDDVVFEICSKFSCQVCPFRGNPYPCGGYTPYRYTPESMNGFSDWQQKKVAE